MTADDTLITCPIYSALVATAYFVLGSRLRLPSSRSLIPIKDSSKSSISLAALASQAVADYIEEGSRL